MKINIEIECTPEEARTFLGLPDVRPMQEAMMAEMQKRMTSTMSIMDPEPLMKAWFTGSGQSLEAFQNLMWRAASSALDPKSTSPDKTGGSGRRGATTDGE